MKRLEHSRIALGRMVVAGALLTGCATRQTPQPPEPAPAPAARPAERQDESPREACLRRRAGIQECLVEAAMQSCRGPRADMAVCVRDQIGQELEFPGTERNLSVIVNGGDEVLSMNLGEFVLISIVKIQAVSVDETGVDFHYTHSQSETDSLSNMRNLVEFDFRVNFDGTVSGEIQHLRGMEIWNLRVSQVADGALVSFSTTDNRITVRQ
jgi:hypothetical protein